MKKRRWHRRYNSIIDFTVTTPNVSIQDDDWNEKKFKVWTQINVSSIQVGGNEAVWAKKTEPIKTAQTYSFLLLTHNFLVVKMSKFQQPLYRCNLFSPNWSHYLSPLHYSRCLQIISYLILTNAKKSQTVLKLLY